MTGLPFSKLQVVKISYLNNIMASSLLTVQQLQKSSTMHDNACQAAPRAEACELQGFLAYVHLRAK